MPNGEKPRSPEELKAMGIEPDAVELTEAMLKGQEPTKETKEILEALTEEGLTKEEEVELNKLTTDPEVLELNKLMSPYESVFKGIPLAEIAQKVDEFKKQHPDLEAKLNRIKELRKKSGENLFEFVFSGGKKEQPKSK